MNLESNEKPAEPKAASNAVRLQGKVSRVGILKYTPAGVPVLEFTVAVPQRGLERESIGYFEVVAQGALAEQVSDGTKVGRSVVLTGSLWARTFKNRQGTKVCETKVVLESFGGINEKDRRF